MEAICEDWCPCQSQFLLKTKNAQQMCCPKCSPKRQRSNLDLFWKKFYYVKNHQKISHVNWIVWIFRQNVPVCQNKRLLKKATFSCPLKSWKLVLHLSKKLEMQIKVFYREMVCNKSDSTDLICQYSSMYCGL